jgi:hypothetical protein
MLLEPQLVCVAAVLSPSTGIIDAHQLMLALGGDLEDCRRRRGAEGAGRSGEVRNDGIRLSVGGSEPMQLRHGP